MERLLFENQNQSNYSGQSQDVKSALNQSEVEANTCNRREGRENACDQVTIVFGIVSESGASFVEQN